MIVINKRKEPNSLVLYKRQPNASFENLDSKIKREVKVALLEDQGYICAYCMKQISLDTMKIEHFKSQKEYPDQALNYSNMLAVCDGGGFRKNTVYETCDTRKKSSELERINPLDTNSMLKVKYQRQGIIFSEDAEFDKELNQVLNLNCNEAFLIENRKKARESLLGQISGKKGKNRTWGRKDLQIIRNQLLKKDKDGRLKPFVGIGVFFIDRKLEKCR